MAGHGLFGILSTQPCCGPLCHQNKIILDQQRPKFHAIQRGLLFVVDFLDVDYKRVFDTKDRVGGFIRIVLEV